MSRPVFRSGKLVLMALMLCTCAGPPAAPRLPFLGRWRASKFPYETPEPCQTMTVEFRADSTLVGYSGEQVLTIHFTSASDHAGFLLRFGAMHTNGRPNCQGLDAAYVLSHQVPQLYVEVRGDTLLYGEGPDEAVTTMIKAP
jgi:hypothetical protein